ncbi:MAG: MFS transporter [Spirochaetales bacterium]|nr:MFS transporter [Spirochaetales bacterium]
MTTATHFRRDRTTWLNYAMLGFYAYALNILGPVTPFLRDELGLSYTVGSLHFSAFALGTVLAGAFGERVARRFGVRRVFWLGSVGIVAGCFGLALGRVASVTVTSAFAMGTFGSLTFSLIPVALTYRHPGRRLRALTEANFVASGCSIGAPFLVSFFAVRSVGWRAALWVAGPMWLALRLAFPRSVTVPDISGAEKRRGPVSFGVRFWLRWAIVFLVVGVEFCVLFWGADYLRSAHTVSAARSAALVGLALVGMFAGRATGSVLLKIVSARALFLVSLLIFFVGVVGVYRSSTITFLRAGMFLTGLGVANLYPVALEYGLKEAPLYEDAASSRIVMASGTAILSFPFIVGGISDAAGLEVVLPVAVLVLPIVALGTFIGLERTGSVDE